VRRLRGEKPPATDPVDAAIRDAGHLTSDRTPHVHMTLDLPRRFRWEWRVMDEAVSPHAVLASGWWWTRDGALRRRHRAYLRVLNPERNVAHFCAYCAAGEGKNHLSWCHRKGVMGGGAS
jgi:hypothetical protein